MDLKAKVEEIVSKLKNDPKLMERFQSDPVKTLEGLTGIDLPDEQIASVVTAIKAKLNLDKLGGLGKLFGK